MPDQVKEGGECPPTALLSQGIVVCGHHSFIVKELLRQRRSYRGARKPPDYVRNYVNAIFVIPW